MEKYIINDTIIEYECIGEGTPILFLHGWGMDRRIMSGCFEPVFENQTSCYMRIYIDLPGMGYSVAGKDIKSSDDMLDVVYHFVKDVIGDEVILVGESYGGYLARGFVNKYQSMVKSIILLCPLVYPGSRNGQVESLCVMERDEVFLQTLSEEQYNSFTYMNVILTESVWKSYERDILSAIEIQNRDFLDNVLEGAFSFDVDELDDSFMKPCLIVVGKQDTEVGYKDQFKLLEKYPNATYCVLNRAGHNLQIEQPELFQSIVKNWLKDNEEKEEMVLLVVDTQKLITNPELYNFDAFENSVKTLIAAARENSVEVIYVRHDDGEGAELTKGTPGFEIYEGFEPLQGEKIFDKTVNSSFKGTGLLEYLKEKNVRTVAVVGLQTDYCIDATIKCGFEHGFKILVPEKANSTFDNAFMTGEQSYKYYNEFMWKGRYAECISVKDTIERMKE